MVIETDPLPNKTIVIFCTNFQNQSKQSLIDCIIHKIEAARSCR